MVIYGLFGQRYANSKKEILFSIFMELHPKLISSATQQWRKTVGKPLKDPLIQGHGIFLQLYLRAKLEDFTQFEAPINLLDIFAERRIELEDYFEKNKIEGLGKRNLFFVKQSNRLQCLNGAYLSDLDERLLQALFSNGQAVSTQKEEPFFTVNTGVQIAVIQQRLGQQAFSNKIKQLYSYQCCFPHCNVNDPRFLVGAHIARWSDNEQLRGHMGNGVCLCLIHDKAFELGLFTLDDDYKVVMHPSVTNCSTFNMLKVGGGYRINTTDIMPLKEALAEHHRRAGIEV